MASVTYCVDCSECCLMSVSCLCAGPTPLHQQLTAANLRTAILEAQRVYVKAFLQDNCFDELCEAIRLASLDPGDASYVALPTHWQTLLRDYINPILYAGATFIYLGVFGFDKINLPHSDAEERKESKQIFFASIKSAQRSLEAFLKANTATYTCYEVEDVDCCCPEEVDLDFDVSTPYPYSRRGSAGHHGVEGGW